MGTTVKLLPAEKLMSHACHHHRMGCLLELPVKFVRNPGEF